MIKELIKLANELDQRGLQKEADALDKIIKEAAGWEDIVDVATYPQRKVWEGAKAVGEGLFGKDDDPSDSPQKPKTDMDHAEEQQALKKKHKAQAAAQAKKKELERRLGETVSWFRNNIFISTPEDQFPLTADKEYLYGIDELSSWDAFLFRDAGKELAIPKGTAFKDLKTPPSEHWLFGADAPSLKEIYNQMRAFIKKNKLNVPM